MYVATYLLVGAITMLVANDSLRGGILRREFLVGMIFWFPLMVGYILGMPIPRVKS